MQDGLLKITRNTFLIVGIMLLPVLSYFNQQVYAQNLAIPKVKGLTLAPLRNELEIAPGVSVDGVLAVTNSTDKPMKVSFTVEKFSVINQQYDYAFTADSDMTKWVTFSNSEVDLLAGESKKIPYTIGVPLSAEPGGRYISLFASTNAQSGADSSINSRQRVASLIYLTVSGDITRSGNMIYLSSPSVINAKGNWSTVLQNTGTTHFRSRYNVQTINLLNNEIEANNHGDALVLPGSLRLINGDLPLPRFPGLYKVIYTIGLGDTPAIIEEHYILYLTPITVIFIFVMLTILIYWLYRRRKLKPLND